MGPRITHRFQKRGVRVAPRRFRFRLAAGGCRWWAGTIHGVVPIVTRAGGSDTLAQAAGTADTLLRGISIRRDHVAYPLNVHGTATTGGTRRGGRLSPASFGFRVMSPAPTTLEVAVRTSLARLATSHKIGDRARTVIAHRGPSTLRSSRSAVLALAWRVVRSSRDRRRPVGGGHIAPPGPLSSAGNRSRGVHAVLGPGKPPEILEELRTRRSPRCQQTGARERALRLQTPPQDGGRTATMECVGCTSTEAREAMTRAVGRPWRPVYLR